MEQVVITGLGTVNPLGNSVADCWENIRHGNSGAGPITRFDASQFATTYAAEVKDFEPKDRIDRRDARKMDRFSHYAVYAALEALEDAGLELRGTGYDKERTGIIIGVGIGGFETIEESIATLIEKGPDRVPPMTIPKLIANIAPAHIAIAMDVHGPTFSLNTACASGTDAIHSALRSIRAGECDMVVTGGVEASITRLGISGFNVIQALSTKYADDPAKASRPFDRDRDGFVMGEGAGILILESRTHAEKRGARIYAEVAGSSMTCDANHLTAPHPEGRGAIEAMDRAIKAAGLEPEQVDYINAHGTSTPINDPMETKAIKEVFGAHAAKVKISSTKSMTGHCVGAAGGIEALVATKALEQQFYPPTINLDNPDPECDLDYVPNTGIEGKMEVAMSNTFGFGGHNGVVILRRLN
ncbi:MAG: beta-ketoacyl-ACP synthase II [Alkalispirochaetaceae bacterium]